MSICPIDRSGYCSRHECVHKGNLLRYALQEDEIGEAYRLLWDERLTRKKSGTTTTLGGVFNFGKAVVRNMKNGFKRLSNEAYEARLSKCDICPHVDKTKEHWNCKLCGCPLKDQSLWPGKARWAAESCDDNRWPLLPMVAKKAEGCGCSS